MNDDLVPYNVPDVILAFTPAPELRELKIERTNLQNIINSHGCNAHPIDGFTVEFLKNYKIGDKSRKMRLIIFHYGGHSTTTGLEYILEKNGNEERIIFSYDELEGFTDLFENIRLIFINGCNSQLAAKFFFKSVEAVIFTTKPIHDEIASLFATQFYLNFLRVQDLNTVFEDTQKFVFNGRTGVSLISQKRDIIPIEDLDEVTPSVFGIEYRDEKFKTSTFKSWVQSIQPLKQVKQDPQTSESKGGGDKSYLLCNRRSLHEKFVRNDLKAKKSNPQPLFIFIHGIVEHCPSDLRDRFTNFTFLEELDIKTTPTKLKFLSPEFDPLDKCQLMLLESYCHEAGFGKQNADKSWSLVKREPDNEFIIIHHNLIEEEWVTKWSDFFNYYLNEFSIELAKFSGKLIIITTRTTPNEQDGFAQYFKSLTSDGNRQIVNLTEFEKIKQFHITQWQEKVFGSAKFNSKTIIPDNEERFFLDIKELLEARLKG